MRMMMMMMMMRRRRLVFCLNGKRECGVVVEGLRCNAEAVFHHSLPLPMPALFLTFHPSPLTPLPIPHPSPFFQGTTSHSQI
jgi:hypothetical protein